MDAATFEGIPLFASLEHAEAEELAHRVEEREVGAGHPLTLTGAWGYFFFVILEGSAEVSHDDEVVATLGPGDYFGETAILEHKRRNATVTSTSPMRLAVLFGADFEHLCREHPAIGARVEATMAERAAADTDA
jgi:CRP-like cAMP-binding protein